MPEDSSVEGQAQRSGSRGTRRIPFGRLALEFVVIVVGVLVALGFDQWMTNIDHRRLVDETLYALAAEIAENTVTLERRMAYHDRILPELVENQRAAEEGERRRISISGALPEGLGLTPPIREVSLFQRVVCTGFNRVGT